jgi:hypothetical protein
MDKSTRLATYVEQPMMLPDVALDGRLDMVDTLHTTAKPSFKLQQRCIGQQPVCVCISGTLVWRRPDQSEGRTSLPASLGKSPCTLSIIIHPRQGDYVHAAYLRVQPPVYQLSRKMLQVEASRMAALPVLVDLAST